MWTFIMDGMTKTYLIQYPQGNLSAEAHKADDRCVQGSRRRLKHIYLRA